jgi:hypothetical protein
MLRIRTITGFTFIELLLTTRIAQLPSLLPSPPSCITRVTLFGASQERIESVR